MSKDRTFALRRFADLSIVFHKAIQRYTKHWYSMYIELSTKSTLHSYESAYKAFTNFVTFKGNSSRRIAVPLLDILHLNWKVAKKGQQSRRLSVRPTQTTRTRAN